MKQTMKINHLILPKGDKMKQEQWMEKTNRRGKKKKKTETVDLNLSIPHQMWIDSLKAAIVRQDTESKTQLDVIYKKFILNMRTLEYLVTYFISYWVGVGGVKVS